MDSMATPHRMLVQYHLSRCFQMSHYGTVHEQKYPSITITSYLPGTSKDQEMDITLNIRAIVLCELKENLVLA